MKKNKIRSILAMFFVISSMVVNSLFPNISLANSMPPPNDVKSFAKPVTAEYEFRKAIRKMEKNIEVSRDGQLILNIQKGSDIEIDEDVFRQLAGSLEITNEKLKSGELILTGNGLELKVKMTKKKMPNNVMSLSQNLACSDGTHSIAGAMEACTRIYWWGREIEFNEAATGAFKDLMASAGGAVALFMPFTGFAIGFVSVVSIQNTDAYGGNQGIVVGQTYLPVILWVYPRGGW